MEKAFSSYDLAGKHLQNRIVMAPMTRSRAGNPGALATDLMATYYAQRASAGLFSLKVHSLPSLDRAIQVLRDCIRQNKLNHGRR